MAACAAQARLLLDRHLLLQSDVTCRHNLSLLEDLNLRPGVGPGGMGTSSGRVEVRSGQHHWSSEGADLQAGLRATAVGPALCRAWTGPCGTPPVLRSSRRLRVHAAIPVTLEDHLPTLSTALPDA